MLSLCRSGRPLRVIGVGVLLWTAGWTSPESGTRTAGAQTAIPAAVRRRGEVSPSERAELYRQLRSQAEVVEKQAAVVKTVAKLVGPTVVHIEAESTNRRSLQLHVGPARQVEESGSGVIVELGGKFYIFSSRHLVQGAVPSAIKINLADGRRIYPEKVWDDRETDVAVLAVSAADLVAAPLGNSDDMEIGDFVVAVGAPFGLVHSVTYGIISAKGRRNLELDDPDIGLQDFLQTDAAINPGNSGGPLANLRGEIIGINTCIASNSGGNEGIGFAVPINMFVVVARQLIEQGKVSRAFLGVTLDSSFGAARATELGLPRLMGARVIKVSENSPAAAADLREGDVILQFNGVAIDNDTHLVNLVKLTQIGKQVTLVVLRDRRTLTVRAVAADRGPGG
jgi:serine protease Do